MREGGHLDSRHAGQYGGLRRQDHQIVPAPKSQPTNGPRPFLAAQAFHQLTVRPQVADIGGVQKPARMSALVWRAEGDECEDTPGEVMIRDGHSGDDSAHTVRDEIDFFGSGHLLDPSYKAGEGA